MVLSPTFISKCQRVFDFAVIQLQHLTDSHPDHFPMYTQNGKWKHAGEAWTNWCEGFLGGQLWLLYLYTQDASWKRRAEHYSKLLERRQHDRNVHDLGFTFMSTWKRWYDLDGDQALRDVVIQAGRTMGMRFQDHGKYLRSFVSQDSLFIDIMMNVGIVFYAAQETHDMELWQKAIEHCITTRRTIVRGDGSTAHEGIFDVATGEFLRQSTHQGWRDDSAWARGLSWALYGFGTAYTFTRDVRFLQTAEACANYYIERTPIHGVPPNDWDEPQPALPYESSAAAIAASGMLSLSRLTGDAAKSAYYLNYAVSILETLTEPQFTAYSTPDWEGILMHGMYHQRKGLGVDESVMWGDYFYLEALAKVLQLIAF